MAQPSWPQVDYQPASGSDAEWPLMCRFSDAGNHEPFHALTDIDGAALTESGFMNHALRASIAKFSR